MPSFLAALIRHQLYLEGLKAGSSKKFAAVAVAMNDEIQRQLGRIRASRLSDLPQGKFKGLERSLKAALTAILGKYDVEFNSFLSSFAEVERSLFIDMLSELTDAPISKLKDARPAADIFAEAMASTLGANGIAPTVFIKQARASAVQKIINLLNQARVNDLTKDEFAASVLGTKKNSYKDGVLQTIVNQNKAVSNTIVQHLSVNTNAEVASTSFAQYEWVSVLDDKTTEICTSRDGKRYPYGKGPLPPAHVNCRSSTMPVGADAGAVDYLDTLTKWAKATPETILKDIFKDTNVDPKNVKPLDLSQYKAKKDNITKD